VAGLRLAKLRPAAVEVAKECYDQTRKAGEIELGTEENHSMVFMF
jgi:hypothetical protein